MARCWIALIFIAASALGADFQTGQAARAVLGQPSFSARDAGPVIQSLAINGDHLYAANAAHQLFAFDLSKIPDRHEDFANRDSAGCSLCGFSPASASAESVIPGVAAAARWGKSVALVDTANHRVLLWRDSSSSNAIGGPDVILGQSAEPSSLGLSTLVAPISVALDGNRLFVGDAALHQVLVWNSLPYSNDQAADAVLGQSDFNAVSSSDSPTADSLQLPVALVSDGVDLFVADPANRRILVFSPGDSPLVADAVVNSASLASGPLSPGTLLTVNAANISDQSASAPTDHSDVLPRRLAGTELILDGEALPLLAVSPQQVQAQIPFALEGRSAASLYLRTEHDNGVISTSNPVAVKLVPANPGLFAFNGTEPRGGILLHASEPGGHTDGTPVTEENPAQPEEIITVWATGLGPIADSNGGLTAVAGVPFPGPAASVSIPVAAQINGQSAQVVSARLLKDAIGVYAVQVLVPSNLGGSAAARLSLLQNGLTSNTVTFSIAPARP